MIFVDFMLDKEIIIDKPYFLATMMYLFAIAVGIGEYTNRAIVFENDIVKFNSVKAKSFRVGIKAMDYRIKYEDIWRISADKLPLIGIYRIRVYGKNLPAAIPINCFFEKYKEMFANFYCVCKSKNPDINFDSSLIEFAEGWMSDE